MARPASLPTVLARVWFPAALVFLLLLALPGFVLLFLNVVGLESAVNTWLKENYRLSYHIPSWWAALLLLLVPFLIVLLYFLKLRRKPLQVPSTFLWKKSIEDLHVNAFFQWLRNNVLLLLQLLALVCLIYSMMDWQLHGHNREGAHYILVIDNSASMSTTDVSPTRLDQAKEEALRQIDDRSDTDVGMVIVFNSEAEILVSYTNDRARLREAVMSIKPTQRPTRIDEALSLAASLANPARSTENEQSRPADEEAGKERTYVENEGLTAEVHLFSDGRFPDVPDFARGNLNMHMHLVGEPGPEKVDNVGIVTFNAARDDLDPTHIQVLVNVHNFTAKPVAAKVALDVRVVDERGDSQVLATFEKPAVPLSGDLGLGEGAEIPERKLTPATEKTPAKDEPGVGTASFELNNIDARNTVVLHARLADHTDRFKLDDEVWLVMGVTRKAKVAIISKSPNRILNAFFNHDAAKKVCELDAFEEKALVDEVNFLGPARKGKWDLVIFDRCAPAEEKDLPLANTFFIDALPPPWKKPAQHDLKQPQVKGWLSRDPLLRSLTALYDIGIAEAFKFDLKAEGVPARTPRLLETDDDVALMFSLQRQSFTDLVMTFPLIGDDGSWMTNWPLQPSFPLFLRNVLYVLGNVSDAGGEESVRPGQVRTIRPDEPEVDEIKVVTPDDRIDKLTRGSRATFSYGGDESVGIYLVKWAEKGKDVTEGLKPEQVKRAFAVNLLDSNESNVEPRPAEQIQIGSAKLKTETTTLTARDTWKWIAAAAVGLLLLEWFIYNRRIFV